MSVYGNVDWSWLTREAAIFVAVSMGEWMRHCIPTQARQVGAIPQVAGSNPTRNQMVSVYLPTAVVYLSK